MPERLPVVDANAPVVTFSDAFRAVTPVRVQSPEWHIGKVVEVQGIPFTIKSIAKGGRLILKVKR